MSIFAVEIINEPTWFFKSKNKMKYNEIGKTGMKVSEHPPWGAFSTT